MKAGRVSDGDEHDARTLAQQIVADARIEADKVTTDVKALASSILADARNEAERITARAESTAAKLRDDAHALATELVRGARHNDDDPGDVQVTNRMPRIDMDDSRPGTVDEVTGLVVRATVPG